MARTRVPDKRKRQGAHFSEKLKGLRSDKARTQQELATNAGISVDMMRAIEGGRSCNPSFFVAIDMLVFLGVDVGELKDWTKEKES